VANIAKHYSKQEWECHCREVGRVYFFVCRHPVDVNDHLTNISHSVRFEVSRWTHFFESYLFELDPELAR